VVNILDLHDKRAEVQDLSSDDMSIEADTGESLEILARGVTGANADDIILESVDEETMLAYEHEDGGGEIFPRGTINNLQSDLLMLMRERGLSAPTIKVPEGQTYQLVNDTSDAGTAVVLYRQGRATDVSANDPGHPANKTRTFITTAETVQNIGAGATETVDLDTSGNPGILRDWPWEEEVPPNREYDVQALMVNLDGDADADHTLDSVRLQSEEREFLAKDSAFVDEVLFDYPDANLYRLPYIFPAEPTFSPGDNLDVQVEVTDGASSAADTTVNACIVAYRRPV